MVAEELAKYIDPALPGKTLIFAATDAHADIVVKALKKAFADAYGEVDDDAVKKITGSVDRVQALVRSFRNDANPKDRGDRGSSDYRHRRAVDHKPCVFEAGEQSHPLRTDDWPRYASLLRNW